MAAILGLLGVWVLPAAAAQQGQREDLVTGWYRDREVKYFDFGDNTKLAAGNTIAAAPIYVFVHGLNADGSPDLVEGQHNIVDVLPGEPGYSDLWQVMMVTVPDGFVPDSIKSKAELDAANLPVTATEMFVNCPIVPAGTTFEDGRELVQGWAKGEEVFYPDFGPNNRSAIPIWVFITGMDAAGNPQFVEGQNNIIDAVPGDAGYSAFWRVNLVTVSAGYEPNSIRSAAGVDASGFPVTQIDMVVNCPVTSVAETAAPLAPAGGATAPVAAPRTGLGDGAGGGGIPAGMLAAAAVLAAGAIAGAAGLAVRRVAR
jgi:hypothetical protein